MSVSTNDFLDQASNLASGECEIDHRSSISRAYYAVYHEARGAAERMSLRCVEKTGAGSHEKLFARYDAAGKRLKIIACRLRQKKLIRASADYDLGGDFTKAEAQHFLADAHLLARELGKLGLAESQVGA